MAPSPTAVSYTHLDPANVWEQDSAQGAVTGENSGEVSDQKETDRENAETEGIHVDIAPIRLE